MSLQIENLKVYYRTLAGDVQALDGVTFNIADGEIMGLAGESGCGKSTLGNSLIYLAGRMKYVEGRVLLDGKELPVWNIREMNHHRFKDLSIIPQYAMSAMNPTRKIGKMTAELLESRGIDSHAVMPEFKRRLDLVGLSNDVLGMYPIELSGGMKQRTVMVISTLLDPSLLIADEITSALDVSTQKAVAEMLVEFRQRGFVKSMIVITHDLSILYQVGSAPQQATSATRLLISSLPEVGVTYAGKRLTGIAGTPPALLGPPEGCRFRERCPFAFEKCLEEPPFIEVEPEHFVACWKEV